MKSNIVWLLMMCLVPASAAADGYYRDRPESRTVTILKTAGNLAVTGAAAAGGAYLGLTYGTIGAVAGGTTGLIVGHLVANRIFGNNPLKDALGLIRGESTYPGYRSGPARGWEREIESVRSRVGVDRQTGDFTQADMDDRARRILSQDLTFSHGAASPQGPGNTGAASADLASAKARCMATLEQYQRMLATGSIPQKLEARERYQQALDAYNAVRGR